MQSKFCVSIPGLVGGLVASMAFTCQLAFAQPADAPAETASSLSTGVEAAPTDPGAAPAQAAEQQPAPASATPGDQVQTATTAPAQGQPATEAETAPDPNSPWIIKDSAPHARRSRLDFTGQVHPFSTFVAGLGAWVYLPIVPNGFISSLNDTFALELGGMFEYFSTDAGPWTHSWMAVTPLAGVRWDFHLTKLVTVFPTVKMGYQIGFNDKVTDDNGDEVPTLRGLVLSGISHFTVHAGAGAYFHFADNFALRVETGYRSLLAVGVSLAL